MIFIFILEVIFALAVALFVTSDYLRAGFPYTHDGENHLARFANYKIAIREGQIPPRFAPNLVNHYGYPVFNYNYPLANILSVPFSIFGVNYEVTFTLLVIAAVTAAILGLYTWLKYLKFSLPSKVLGVIIFSLSPFLLNTLIFRGNIGELMALALFSWLLVLVERIRQEKPVSQLIPGALIWAAFLLSHNVSAMFGLPLIILYAGLRLRRRRSWLQLGATLVGGVLLTLWFWLPAIVEKSQVVLDQVNLTQNFTAHFPTLSELLFSPLRFGFSYPGSIDSLSFGLGLIQWVGLAGAIIYLCRRWWHHKTQLRLTVVDYLTIAAVLLVVFQLPITAKVWQLIPLAHYIQFPWRLSLFFSILVIPVILRFWKSTRGILKLGLWLLLLIQLVGFTRATPVDYFHRTNIDYDAFTQSTTILNENTPTTFSYSEISDWQPTPTLNTGLGQTEVEYWTGSEREYLVEVSTPATVTEPTMNFSGWETIITPENSTNDADKRVVTYIDDDQIGGRLAYQLEPGRYKVHSRFTQKTWPRLIGNTVSAIALFCLGSYLLIKIIGKTLGGFLSWKIGLFFIGFSASAFLIYDPTFPYAEALLSASGLPQWVYSWANFDGVHYLTIADKGYLGTGLIQAFFPVLPKLIQAANLVTHNYLLGGVLVTTVFGFLLLKAWLRLLDQEHLPRWLSAAVLFLFPTALFFNALYTEAVFLTFVLWSFLAARQGRWWRAGIAALLASATRVTGVLLVPALVWELGEQVGWSELQHNITRHWKKLAAVLLGILGLASYMLYLQRQFGDPFYFFHVQQEFGGGRQESLVWFPQVVWRYIQILRTAHPLDLRYAIYLQEAVAGVGGLALLIWSWFKVRKSYVIFSLLSFLVPTLTGTFSSLPRYILSSFAIFILITQLLAKHRWARYGWLGLSTLLLIFNTILFIQGYWVA